MGRDVCHRAAELDMPRQHKKGNIAMGRRGAAIAVCVQAHLLTLKGQIADFNVMLEFTRLLVLMESVWVFQMVGGWVVKV